MRLSAVHAFSYWVALCLPLLPACTSSPALSAEPQPARAGAAATSPARLRFAAGTTYEYDLSLNSSLRVGAHTELAQMALRGTLRVAATSAAPRAGASALLISMVRPELTAPEGDRAALDAVARELEAGFLAEVEGTTVRAVRMTPSPSPFAANLAQTIAAQLQLGEGGASRHESDAAGAYEIEYRVSDASHFSKRKLRYAPRHVKSPTDRDVVLTLTPEVQSSEGSVELLQGRLQSSTYTEKLKAQLAGNGDAISELSLSFRFSREHASPSPSHAEWTARTVDLSAVAPAAIPRDATNLDRSIIGEFTLDSAVRALAELNNGPLPLLVSDPDRESAPQRKQREERLARHDKAFAALVAILRTDPAAVAQAGSQVRRRGGELSFVLDALSGAKSAAAQAELVALADADLPAELRVRAVKSLSRTPEPSTATVRALLRWLPRSDYGVYAIYGLGTMARALRAQGQAELAGEATSALANRLQRERDVSERVHLLRGVANSGDPALLSLVRPLITNKNSSIRGAAIESIRLMDHAEVDALIAARLKLEQNAVTLLAVLNAAKTRRPSAELAAALTELALHGKGEQARQQAVTLLGGWLPQRPELRGALSEVSEHDISDDIRSIAKQALQAT
jgi:hypothetical protein